MGGASPDDNSGVLNFVRVEYAGKEIFPGNELNGITFGGVSVEQRWTMFKFITTR